MFDVSLGGALLAGLLSFVSPCVLPLVPPYFAWLAGVSFESLTATQAEASQRYPIVAVAIAFVLGFTTVFVALGATANIVGKAIAQHFGLLSVIAGLVIIAMGLHFIGVFRIGLLYRQARIQLDRKPPGLPGAYVIGLAFAFGWTPCVGPVLATILFIAGSEGSALHGATLLAAYSLGIGIPFVAAAFFIGPFLRWAARFRKHMHKVEMTMGVLLVLTGILFVSGQMPTISYWLLKTFPALQTVG